MRALCFATGNLWRLIGKKDIFEIISQLDVEGVEFTFGKTFEERPLLEKEFDILKKFKYNSIHAPFLFSLKYMSESKLYEGLNVLRDYSKKINSSQVVIHPTQVFPKDFFKSSSLGFLAENLNPKKGKDRPHYGFEDVLDNNSDFGLCLDASHAYDWGVSETEYIVKKWKHRIKQVHLSNNRYHKDHQSFEKVGKNFLKSIEPLRELDVPIVIEEDMKFSTVQEINEEIKRIKEILGF